MKCISPVYVRKIGMSVPCGKCAFCISRAINAWCVRLGHEMAASSSAHFLTLTYNDEHLPPNQDLSKRDLQLFIKRLRKRNPGIRYFAVGEYGTDFQRPHYHAVIFNLLDLNLVTASWVDQAQAPMGYVTGSRATMGRIRYMVSYMATPVYSPDKVSPFRLMSRKPGIGFSYVEKMGEFHRARSDGCIHDFDVIRSMPRYYTDKIFDRGQRRYIKIKQMAYALQNDQPVCSIEHDRLLKKLNRKQK